MNGFLFFISGLIVGIILATFLYKKILKIISDEKEEGDKYPPITDADMGLGVETIENGEKTTLVKLQPMSEKLTGRIENDVVAISFYLPDLFPELSDKNYPNKSSYPLIEEAKGNFSEEKITEIALLDECKMGIIKLFVNGRVKIYSKTDAEFVNEFRYCGKSEIKGRLSGSGSFRFYLPSGRLFLEIPTWTS